MKPEDDTPSDNEDKKETDAASAAEEEASHAEASNTVATEEDSHVDDEQSMATAPDQGDDDDDDDDEEQTDEKVKSTPGRGDDEASKADTPTSAAGNSSPQKLKQKVVQPSVRRGRAPAVKGLTIPFRTVKKAMKLDPDIPIVQNEAAIMTTMAAELFLKSLAKESQQIAKNRGRNTIRYEDVAEARSNDPALAFLQTLIP